MLTSFNHLHFLAGKCPCSNLNFPIVSSRPTTSTFMENGGDGQENKKKRPRKAEIVCESTDDIEDFTPKEVAKIRASLLRWYYENRRLLPWRVNQDDEEKGGEADREGRAYAVWVSEVMLQQTRVTAVVDYYNRWMEKWPTVYHLAKASQEEVNDMWAGLGYYRRARFLLEGAKSIAETGEFPSTFSALHKVNGIGDYTAGAIASIAFKEVVPVVDGNVIRVVSRLKAISANPKKSATVKSFWKLAGQLTDPSKPGDFNQALMELGATVCTPTSPRCSLCPISDQCHAMSLSVNNRTVKVTDFPIKVAKVEQRSDFAAVSVVEITDHSDIEFWKASNENSVFFLVKRPEEGLLAGLWEFPSVLLDKERLDVTTRRKAMDQYLRKSLKVNMKSCSLLLREDIGEYVHIFSHIKLKMHVELLVLCVKGGVKSLHSEHNENLMGWKYVDKETIQGMGLTSGVRKVYNMIQSFRKQEPTKSTRRKKRL